MIYTTTKKRNLKAFKPEGYGDIIVIQDSDGYCKIFLEMIDNDEWYYFYAEQKFEGDFNLIKFLNDNYDDIQFTRGIDLIDLLDDYEQRLNLVSRYVLS